MIRAAIVGIGWWGRMLVNSIHGQSSAIQFTTGHTRTRAAAEEVLHGVAAFEAIVRSAALHQPVKVAQP